MVILEPSPKNLCAINSLKYFPVHEYDSDKDPEFTPVSKKSRIDLDPESSESEPEPQASGARSSSKSKSKCTPTAKTKGESKKKTRPIAKPRSKSTTVTIDRSDRVDLVATAGSDVEYRSSSSDDESEDTSRSGSRAENTAPEDVEVNVLASEWSKDLTGFPNVPNFQGDNGLKLDLDEDWDALKCFELFF